jgi:hypothetical protein
MIKEAILAMGYQNGIKVRQRGETLGVDPTGVSNPREAQKKGGGFGKTDTKLLEAVRSAIS